MTEENSNQNGFLEQARSLVEKIGYKLGHDAIRETKQLCKKDLAIIIWEARNNTYNYDTAYLVWENKDELKSRVIADSKGTKEHIHINDILEDEKAIFIKISYTDPSLKSKYKNNKESKYSINKKDL